MVEDNNFRDLIRRIRTGDAAAATELVRDYEPAIRRAARIRLVDPRLRRMFDSMDICQSVFGSFFVRAALGEYDLDRPESLLKLLVSMSRKKLVDRARAEGAARRDFRRIEMGPTHAQETQAHGDSPSQEVALSELIKTFHERLSLDERYLADQRSLGRDWAEIAAEKGVSADSLRKQLERAIGRVSRSLGLEGSV
jgi:RNA polymerase sigma factor (sigma-70 family)